MRADNDYILNTVDLEEEVNDEQNDYDKTFSASWPKKFYPPILFPSYSVLPGNGEHWQGVCYSQRQNYGSLKSLL